MPLQDMVKKAAKIRLSANILFFIGIFFFTWPAEYTRSTCWGHLGCNYFERLFSPMHWLGILLAMLGVIGFYKGVVCSKISKWLVISLALILFLAWYHIYRPAIVFAAAKGNPECANCIISKTRDTLI